MVTTSHRVQLTCDARLSQAAITGRKLYAKAAKMVLDAQPSGLLGGLMARPRRGRVGIALARHVAPELADELEHEVQSLKERCNASNTPEGS
jgi:hypothetical protein